MTIDELRKGEHETVEFKQDIPAEKEKYLKTAVAFANAAGGQIVFGVENNTWDVLGYPADEVFTKMDAITNSIFDACEPSVVPIMEIEEIDGKKIIVATIRPGMAKPYYLRKKGMMEGTYIRIAGVTRKAEPYMIKELQLEGTGTSFDTLQVVGEVTNEEIEDLCDRMYHHALDRCTTEEQRIAQKKVTVNQLVSWKILVFFNGKYYPTNAWKLLTDPEELFPEAVIQMAVFKGDTRAVFLDRKTATGPIDQQIEEAMLFVKRNIRMGSRIAGLHREDIYELPIDSIREMISNAVCHRSYVSQGSIQVAIYDDRLEVTSPGRISPDLTMEQMLKGNSRVRNVAIGAAFQYMHIIEKWGTGIPRIYKEAKEYSLKEPELKDFGTSFRICIYRKEAETDVYGVVNHASDAANNATSVTDTATDATDNGTDATNNATDTATNATDTATNATDTATDATDNGTDATNNATDVTDAATDTATNATDTATDVTDTATDTATNATDTATDNATDTATSATNNATNVTDTLLNKLSRNERTLLHYIKNHPTATQKETANATGIAIGTVKRLFPSLQKKAALKRNGNHKEGSWEVLIKIPE
ncbi:MAG: putative DNA binding domain-containing protein [Clostridia bacterium]|nr:putative DNA binding domain-containing protein [Clostridia bacterium]